MRAVALRHTVALFGMILCASTARAEAQVRIGVLGLFHPNQIVLQMLSGQTIVVAAHDTRVVLNGEAHRQRMVFRAQGDQVLADNRVATEWIAAARDGASTRFLLSIPGKIHRVYVGKLSITARHGELSALVTMDIETAVLSIVAAEMPANAPLEALKAQAVVARSFLSSGSRHAGYDFCDTTHCQFLRSPDDANPHVLKAVKATHGEMLAYKQKPFPAMYSSRCGGDTLSLRELGMDSGDGYPYYAVQCRWCRQHPVQWQSRLATTAEPPPSRNERARIAQSRQWGWSAIPGSAFTAEQDAHGLLISGHSIGHSLGMCQFGAIGMAAAGADYRSILAHYYPNTELTSLR